MVTVVRVSCSCFDTSSGANRRLDGAVAVNPEV